MSNMTRDEHLAWCKRRALEYLDEGDVVNALTSMQSDLSKHEELKGIADKMAPLAMFIMVNPDLREARRYIEGFR